MASHKLVEILEVCQVAPTTTHTNSAQPPTSLSLIPLAFPDLQWFRFPPVERLFFYQLPGDASSLLFFNSEVIPKLKNSLSATLAYFPPVAGRVVWPSNSPIPIILCTSDHGVSLTVAISDADFDHLSCDGIRESMESHPFIPKLPVSADEAAVLALQVTLFPGKGFVIGYASHHAVLDGKSISMFFRAWAYLCKLSEVAQNNHPKLLPEELTPVLDRTVIKDPLGISSLFLKTWELITKDNVEFSTNPRNVKLLPNTGVTNTVRSTFLLTREDQNKLRQKVMSQLENNNDPPHLSTFALTCAYVLVCMVRARGGDDNRKIFFIIAVDCRGRSDPPVPANYFGNCIAPLEMIKPARDFESVSVVAERISSLIKGLGNDQLFKGADEKMLKYMNLGPEGQKIGVAGSTRLELYGTDFGWGRPKKVEVVSIDRTGAISLSESRDGNGGVEIGLALVRNEMEAFASFFANGLTEL